MKISLTISNTFFNTISKTNCALLLFALAAVLGTQQIGLAQWENFRSRNRSTYEETRLRQQNENMSGRQRIEDAQKLYEEENARAGIISAPREAPRQIIQNGEIDPMIERRRQRNLQRMSQISPPTPLPTAIARRSSSAQEINLFTLPGLESKAMGPLQLDRFK